MESKRILVVDDNPSNLKLLQYLLQHHGYTVHTASDGESALEAVITHPPRLVLMDLQLPGMDGFEVTRRLRADPATAHIPVVAVTAYAMKGDEEKARAAGCSGYVTKPIDTRALPRLLADLLGT